MLSIRSILFSRSAAPAGRTCNSLRRGSLISKFGALISTRFRCVRGNARLAELGIEHARLIIGKADDLSQFADRSFDVVFTDAVLCLIGPDKIGKVISEMKRISQRALVFVELHSSGVRRDPTGLGVFTRDGWVRDYRKLLSRFFSDDSITFKKIPADVWPEGRWKDYGSLITVML